MMKTLSGKTRGRPKGSTNRKKKILVAVRLKKPFVSMLKAIAKRGNKTQCEVLEICLSRYSADINL